MFAIPWEGPQLDLLGELLITAIAAYVLLVLAGRLMKWKFGVRLGIVYQFFALTLGLFNSIVLEPLAADRLLRVNLPGQREFAAVAFLLGSVVLGRLIDQFFWRWYFEERRRTAVPKFIREITTGLLLLTAALVVLEYGYGAHVHNLLAASGVVGIILGFALQDSLGNIVAGFALQYGRPFAVGDWLLIDNRHVRAVEINWRSTRFVTGDEVQLDVPNQQLVRQTLINYHGGESRHAMRLEVGVDNEVPPNKVKDVLRRAVASAEGVLPEPPPDVYLKEFGDNAMIYEVRFWLRDHDQLAPAADAARTNIWYALQRQRIKIPCPTLQLRFERAHRSQRDPSVMNEEQRALATRDLLRTQPVFKHVGDNHLQMLVRRSAVHHYGRGELIIREGAEGASMFVLVAGEARVSVLQGGHPTWIASLRGGDCFGEMSLLTGEKRSASIQAVSDCEVMEITKPVFAEIIALDSQLLPGLSELLAKRQMQTEDIMQAAAQQPSMLAAKEEEYRAGFLDKLRSFFEL